MANLVGDDVLDFGLTMLDLTATHIYIVSADPTTYGEATTGGTYALGNKSFGAGGCFGAPGAGSPNGRRVQSASITDGTITNSGTATGWAVVSSAASKLYANGDLSATQVVTSGNTFQLGAFYVNLANQ